MSGLQRCGRQEKINVKSEEELAMADASEVVRKQKYLEERKAEVRKRLEEDGQKQKKKKGFLTPERKKKLRKLLMLKAADDLKKQQLDREAARHKILAERTIPLPEVDSLDNKGKLHEIYEHLWTRMCQLEEEKFDINHLVTSIGETITALNIEVNGLKGKFVKPSLKKVSKYDNKFKKLAEKPTEEKLDFRNSLKAVKRDHMEDITNLKKRDDKPAWNKKSVRDRLEADPTILEQAQQEQEIEAHFDDLSV